MSTAHDLTQLTVQDFVEFLKQQGIKRFFFVYNAETQRVRSSHPQLQVIADFLQTDRRDFMQHEGLFFHIVPRYDILQGAFIHRTNRGQASGGGRFWHYEGVEDFLRDGLRLSKGMTRKNALAGLWWGGGKGIIAQDPSVDFHKAEIRASIFRSYGTFVSSLRGCYLTAEDVGTDVTDMASIFSATRFITCIPYEFGGSGNPSEYTARGVVCAMEAALEFSERGDLRGKTVAVEGIGHVGMPLIRSLLRKRVKKVSAWDVDAAHVEPAEKEFAGRNVDIQLIEPDDLSIFQAECDIFAPCATGAVLNPRTIPLLQAGIVCGAANNQLEDNQRDDRALQERGIVYVPDFLANRMGIVHCANEQYGYVNNDHFIERHLEREWEHSIHHSTLHVLRTARETGKPPMQTAIHIADEFSLQEHPLFGHRGQQIMRSLVENRWHEA